MISELQHSFSDILDYINQTESAQPKFDNNIKISFLRNFTIENIEPFIKYHNYRANISPQIFFGGYDNVLQEILDDSSHLYTQKPELIVLALVLEQFSPDFLSPNWSADSAIESLKELYGSLSKKSKSLVAVNTFTPPFYSELGITNAPELKDRITEVAKLNTFIRKHVNENFSQFYLIDWERFLRILGEKESMDYRFWYTSKAPFKKSFLNMYAFELTKIIKALKGKAKKCLILDCDNTLWGGIVGEDGLMGIKLDRNNYPGSAYYEFQQNVLDLHERGVLIVICSKNNEDDVWEVFEKHPHCLLKKSHLAAWKINWNDKVSNTSVLAKELNLGLDSLVFVDDNPAECEIIKLMLPDVKVIKVPDNLYTYPHVIIEEGLFDTLYLSIEDKLRTQMYKAEAQRKTEESKFEKVEQFLASLNIAATIHEAKEHEIPRIAQLTQKTNQFNLTTRRYSEKEIESYINDPLSSVFSLGVKDKFGDSGLTGVLIFKKVGNKGVIDSFLLSCRIIGRKLEIVFLINCMSCLEKRWGITAWEAEYIPTKKNQQTADFWEKMGFEEIVNKGEEKKYRADIDKYNKQAISYITVGE